jgi:hypothetical protein
LPNFHSESSIFDTRSDLRADFSDHLLNPLPLPETKLSVMWKIPVYYHPCDSEPTLCYRPLTNRCNRIKVKLMNYTDLYKNILITRTRQDSYNHSEILNLIWTTWHRGSLSSNVDTTTLTKAYLPLQSSCAPIFNYFEHANNRRASIINLFIRINYVITTCVWGYGRL